MKNKDKLIIFLPKFLYSGAGNSVFSLINFLDKEDFEIHVLCLGRCDYKKSFNKKIIFHELKDQSLLWSLPKIFFLIKRIRSFSKRTIIYSNHHYANIYSILIKLFLNKVYVIGVERTCIFELSSYFSVKDFFKKNFIKIMVHLLYPYANSIISNTLYTKNEIRNFSKLNVKHVYPPSIKYIKPFKGKKINKDINILWVGRLSFEKGVSDLIESINFLNIKANIFILGHGYQYLEIKNLMKKQKNKKIKIHLKKYVKNTIKYYRKSHILVNTSFYEGSNNSIIEAINNDLAVIASDTPGGNKELLKTNLFGLLYKKNNPKDLANKLHNIISKYNQFQIKIKRHKKLLNNFLSLYSNKNSEKIIKRVGKTKINNLF